MSRPDLRQRIEHARQQRIALGRQFARRAIGKRDGARVEIEGRWLTEFSSNDYLGLSQQFSVAGAMSDAAARSGAGSGSSPLATGHHAVHEALEREIADWLGYPRGLLFGSGYLANLAVMQALLGEHGDVCVQDALNHPSLFDAAQLAGCELRRYAHVEADAAAQELRASAGGAAMLATDGVFGMDGDIAPLRSLNLAARAQQALLYVDDAHGVGVRGPDGRGSVAAARLGVGEVPLQLVTLGKAIGGYGAVVVGEEILVRHLAETAQPYLRATALPPALAAGTLEAVKLARREHWRRDKLRASIARFRAQAGRQGFELLDTDSAIQPVLCGSDEAALMLSGALENAGFLVVPMCPPAVPEGSARLRITLSALHAPEQVDALVAALARARDNLGKGIAKKRA